MEAIHIMSFDEARSALSTVLLRWKNETPHEAYKDSNVQGFVGFEKLHEFRIDHIERLPNELHKARKPITDLFLLSVTHSVSNNLALPWEDAPIELISRDYEVKHFVDKCWRVSER